MGRLLIRSAIAATLLLAQAAWAATDLHASLELGYVKGSDHEGFLEGGLGKAPYGGDGGGWKVLDGYLEVTADVGRVWDAKLTLTASEALDPLVAISEATLTYRPLPESGRRFRVKLGAFRPPVSFEHDAAGWASRYSVTASAINTWVGQEIGGLAVEARLASDAATGRGSLDWDLFAAGFMGNDASGTLLSWSGWSFWSGQTRWGDQIPLSDLPLLAVAPYQAPVAEPFVETDNRPGFWLGGTLGERDRYRLRYVYYDNQADPNSQARGQWGWRTRFHSIGFQANLPARFGFIAQWMQGSTDTWQVPGIGTVVDAGFDSYFLLLSRRFGESRLTLRYDDFAVQDRDGLVLDPNDEEGQAWMVSYHRPLSERWQLTAEVTRIESRRPARELQSLPIKMTERIAFVTLAWTL